MKAFVLITKEYGIHQFYTINKIIRIKLVEHGPVKTVTHISDPEELIPDTNIYNL